MLHHAEVAAMARSHLDGDLDLGHAVRLLQRLAQRHLPRAADVVLLQRHQRRHVLRVVLDRLHPSRHVRQSLCRARECPQRKPSVYRGARWR